MPTLTLKTGTFSKSRLLPHLRAHYKKDISLYRDSGLVQLQDKIVVRFALTIYPYSLGKFFNFEMSAFGAMA